MEKTALPTPVRLNLSIFALLLFLSSTLVAESSAPSLDPKEQWPQWRGPSGNGVAPHGDPPVSWAEDKNVRFKIEIPGTGHSTPIIWGDRLFLTTAQPHGEPVKREPHDAHEEHAHGAGQEDPGAHDNSPPDHRQRFIVLAIDRHDGKILWQRTVADVVPHESTHVTSTWASNSSVTDGERLYAYFGSRGLYALDMAGEILWQKDFGDMRTRHAHGEGSSPALYGGTLVVNWDHQGESFVLALDSKTGEELWREARDEITSWATPLIIEHAGKAQVITSATQRVRSYDLETGAVLWESGGLSRNVVASPVAEDGMVYVANSYDWQAMLAIRLADAKGDVSATKAIVWKRDRDTPYVPSPLLYQGMLFFLKHSHAFLTNVEAKTGQTHFGPVRLRGLYNIFASPVGAADRIYILSREGTAAVLKRSESFEVLALNQLDDSFSASPAIVAGELYLRGQKFLYCIAEDPSGPT